MKFAVRPRGGNDVRALPWVILGVAVASFLQLCYLELTARAAIPLQVDETFFATCAARGLVTGEIPISGCHDSKAPMIFWLYQLILGAADPYNFFRLKIASILTGCLVAVQVGWFAHKLAGIRGACIGIALVLQIFVIDPSLLALKTELVGGFFTLAGLIVLYREGRVPGTGRLLLSGSLLGVAMMTKQTFAFAAVGILVWWGMLYLDRRLVSMRQLLSGACAFALGLWAPFTLFLVYFGLQERSPDFLASVFLYPAVYGSPEVLPLFKRLAWRLGSSAELLQSHLPLTLAGTAAAIAGFQLWRGCKPGQDSARAASMLLVLVLCSMALVPVISPVMFGYHFLPAWIFCGLLGGALIGTYATPENASSSELPRMLLISTLAWTVIVGLSSWYGDRHKAQQRVVPRVWEGVDASARGRFGYAFGISPDFYVSNGLIPSSDIMFPPALPGVQPFSIFNPPHASTLRGRWLKSLNDRNASRMLEDFKTSPPSYIVAIDPSNRKSTLGYESEFSAFREYVARWCESLRPVDIPPMGAATLYKCTSKDPGKSLR